MTNFKKQIVSAAAAGAMFLNLATPVLAGTYEISGSGAGSENDVSVIQNNTTKVTQNNTSNVTNTVNAEAETGENDANLNTGGDVVITTGNAKVDTTILNKLNVNKAHVDCCEAGDMKGTISGNSAYSDNELLLNSKNRTEVDQDNRATVRNTVEAEADTGDNDASLNNGGKVVVSTGNAVVGTQVFNKANVNSARVGNGSHGHSDNPSATFVISGNGAGSDNYIGATIAKNVKLLQDNVANVTNNVDAEAETGENDANLNTGGDVVILSGFDEAGAGVARVTTIVDNAVNFNHADVDCGCSTNTTVKIFDNGADTDPWWFDGDDNTVALQLDSLQSVGQGNLSTLNNQLDDLEAETGDNEASSNTGATGENSDPAVITGNAIVETGVSNSGGVNVLGELPFEMPEVETTFDMSVFWAFFQMSFNI